LHHSSLFWNLWRRYSNEKYYEKFIGPDQTSPDAKRRISFQYKKGLNHRRDQVLYSLSPNHQRFCIKKKKTIWHFLALAFFSEVNFSFSFYTMYSMQVDSMYCSIEAIVAIIYESLEPQKALSPLLKFSIRSPEGICLCTVLYCSYQCCGAGAGVGFIWWNRLRFRILLLLFQTRCTVLYNRV
jgi:hypothetical protein